jgi:hypothetical protein
MCIFVPCIRIAVHLLDFNGNIGRTEGTIVPARGPKDFGWDPIFVRRIVHFRV